jgi:3D (Asp-Asp-Asp) domain-containing protein
MIRVAAFVGIAGMVALSAVITKAAVVRSTLRPLADVEATPAPAAAPAPTMSIALASIVEVPAATAPAVAPLSAPVVESAPAAPTAGAIYADSSDTRYFNGRAIRPARTLKMVVTAYSPDEKSCGPDACGITSSLHHVDTNAMKLVAADSKVLPLGSMITVPGYDTGRVVPVLDRGGAIKGNRLDVLFPTDAAARQWGVKTLDVVVWEYADNLPADDFRAIRDSKN